MFGEYGSMGAGMWLFWILLIAVIILIVKGLSGSGSSTQSDHQPSPLELLKARYARGEIDKDTFESMRKDLE